MRSTIPETPHARREDVIVEELSDETLVYDRKADVIHCLAAPMAMLFRLCVGRTSASMLAQRLAVELCRPVSLDEVSSGIESLTAAGLLTGTKSPKHPSRRRWMKSAAAIGFGLVTIAAPTTSEAATMISDLDCMRQNPANCGGAACRQNPGNSCRRVVVLGVPACSCNQN